MRLVTKSPSFITHEDNAALWLRLGLEDPILSLRRLLERRLQSVHYKGVASLQSVHVHQWYELLPVSFSESCFAPSTTRVDQSALGARAGTDQKEQPAGLTEVTAVVETLSCNVCGLSFATRASLRAHVTRKHQGGGVQSAARAKAAAKNKNLRSQYMVHSVEGLPICKHCLKEFTGWPQFAYHFANASCSVLHAEQGSPPQPGDDPAPCPAIASINEDTAVTPAMGHMSDPQFVQIAKGPWQTLAHEIRKRGRLNHCPVCQQ